MYSLKYDGKGRGGEGRTEVILHYIEMGSLAEVRINTTSIIVGNQVVFIIYRLLLSLTNSSLQYITIENTGG